MVGLVALLGPVVALLVVVVDDSRRCDDGVM
jgi:hypothetical protein